MARRMLVLVVGDTSIDFLARKACKLWGIVGQYDNFPWTWDDRVVMGVACPSVGKFIACCRRALEGAKGWF